MGAVLLTLENEIVVERPFDFVVIDVYYLSLVSWHVVDSSFFLERPVGLPLVPRHVHMRSVCDLLVLV